MAKKTLDTVAIANELQHSAFFPAPATTAAETPSDATRAVVPVPSALLTSPAHASSRPTVPALAASTPPVHSTTTEYTLDPDHSASRSSAEGVHLSQPLKQPLPTRATPAPPGSGSGPTSRLTSSDASPHASDPASMLAPMSVAPGPHDPDLVEAIRKAVRHVGKEVSFVRLTPDEKRQLTDIAYTYKSQGLKTSENEISRIGINWMLEDYHANGRHSVLAQVLAALDA